MTSVGELSRDVVILSCAVSGGIHGALVPDHFTEGTGAGVGFVVATVLLAAPAFLLTYRASSAMVTGAVLVFAGLLASYALAVTTGLPLLHPDVEPVEGLAVLTKAVEALGLLAATHLLWHRRPAAVPHLPRLKGRPT
jgi:hypothetical protein